MKYLSVTDFGNKIGVSRQRIDQLIRSGRIKFELAGKIRIISEDTFNQFKRERGRK